MSLTSRKKRQDWFFCGKYVVDEIPSFHKLQSKTSFSHLSKHRRSDSGKSHRKPDRLLPCLALSVPQQHSSFLAEDANAPKRYINSKPRSSRRFVSTCNYLTAIGHKKQFLLEFRNLAEHASKCSCPQHIHQFVGFSLKSINIIRIHH